MNKTPVIYETGSHKPLQDGDTLPGSTIQISQDAGNGVTIGSDGGLMGQESGLTSVVVSNTRSVHMAGTGSTAAPIQSTVQIDPSPDNILATTAAGLRVSATPTNINTQDTTSVQLAGNGDTSTPLSATVKLDTNGVNMMNTSDTGLNSILYTANSGTVELTGAGTSSNTLTAGVRVSADTGNIITTGSDGGLYAVPSASTSGPGNIVVIADSTLDQTSLDPTLRPFVLPANTDNATLDFGLAEFGMTADDVALYSALYMRMGVFVSPVVTPFTMFNSFGSGNPQMPAGTNGLLSVSIMRVAGSGSSWSSKYWNSELLPIGDGVTRLRSANTHSGAMIFSDRVVNPEEHIDKQYFFRASLRVYADDTAATIVLVSNPITVTYAYTLFGVLK